MCYPITAVYRSSVPTVLLFRAAVSHNFSVCRRVPYTPKLLSCSSCFFWHVVLGIDVSHSSLLFVLSYSMCYGTVLRCSVCFCCFSFRLSVLSGCRYMGAPTGVDAEAMRLQNEEYKKENEELRSKLQILTEKARRKIGVT